MGEPRIRALSAGEHELLTRIAVFHVAMPAAWWPEYRPDPAAVRETARQDVETLTADSGTVLVMESGSELLGFLRLQELPERRVQVASLWVAPDRRGRGLGGGLLAAGTDWALARGNISLTSDVHRSNGPMLALSAQHGWDAEWITLVKALDRPAHPPLPLAFL